MSIKVSKRLKSLVLLFLQVRMCVQAKLSGALGGRGSSRGLLTGLGG